jgi:hypothetical protein
VQCPTACHHVAQPEVLSQFVVLTSPLHLLKLKILEFANSIRSFLAHLSKLRQIAVLATTRLYVPEILFSAEKTRQEMFGSPGGK